MNDLLSLNTSIPDLSEDRLIERPKVVYNENTSKYVMWMHVDSTDYGDAKAGVATSDSVCGDYTYIESVNPMDNQSRDMTLFVDNDNTGYLISEDRDAGTHFYQLSDDYLTVESDVGVISFDSMDGLESPAVVNVDGVYYFFGSQLTGWDPVSLLPISGKFSLPPRRNILTKYTRRMITNTPPPTACLAHGRRRLYLLQRAAIPVLPRQHMSYPLATEPFCTWVTAGSRIVSGIHVTSGCR